MLKKWKTFLIDCQPVKPWVFISFLKLFDLPFNRTKKITKPYKKWFKSVYFVILNMFEEKNDVFPCTVVAINKKNFDAKRLSPKMEGLLHCSLAFRRKWFAQKEISKLINSSISRIRFVEKSITSLLINQSNNLYVQFYPRMFRKFNFLKKQVCWQ